MCYLRQLGISCYNKTTSDRHSFFISLFNAKIILLLTQNVTEVALVL